VGALAPLALAGPMVVGIVVLFAVALTVYLLRTDESDE
jgi:hypothetical protein